MGLVSRVPAMYPLRRAAKGRAPYRRRVHVHAGTVRDLPGGRKAAVAFARLRGEIRHAGAPAADLHH